MFNAIIGPIIHQLIIHEAILIPVFTSIQYEQTRESVQVYGNERRYRVSVRSNITRALTALDLTTVNDIQQTSAALAQCTVSRKRGMLGWEERKEGRKNKETKKEGHLQRIKLEMKETVKKANK